MASVAALLAEGARLPGDDPRRDAEVLLCAALARPRSYLYAWPDADVTAADAARYRDWLTRRRAGTPVAYLLGHREFWSLSLEVGPATLIPRPETELLVEIALALELPAREFRSSGTHGAARGHIANPAGSPVAQSGDAGVDGAAASDRSATHVADLGTGSGAIALAIATERPAWRVAGVDVSAAAIAIAERNRQRLALVNLELLVGDWFAPLAGRRFDLLISNPPYLAADDPHLGRGDLPFEPEGALVAGEEGTEALRKIVDDAPDYLFAGGWLLLEHGMAQGRCARELLCTRGFDAIGSRRDLAQHERVTLGRWPGGGSAC